MPDVGAQSMLGGWALSHGAKNGTGLQMSSMLGGECYRFVVMEPIWDGPDSPEGWYNVVFCVAQLVSMAWLMWKIWSNDRAALRGDYEATKKLILPVYHQIVYWLVWFEVLSVAFIVLRLAGKILDSDSVSAEDLAATKAAFIGLDWAFLHWIIDGVAVFLCQPSAGKRAMKRAVVLGFVPALLSFVMGFLKHRATVQPFDKCRQADTDPKAVALGIPLCVEGACGSEASGEWGPGPSQFSCLWFPLIYQMLLLLVYLRVWLAPAHNIWVFPRVYRREAAIGYVRFWSVFRILTLVASLCLIQTWSPTLVDFGFCMDFGAEAFVFTLAKAVVIYDALRHDSAFWQAETPETQSSVDRQSRLSKIVGLNRSKNTMAQSKVVGNTQVEAGLSLTSPLVGRVDIEHADAEVINSELDTVETSIVIPWGFLQLNKDQVLGYGGTARVYRAKLHQKTVAAKVMFCPSIEPVMVRNFFKEAKTLKQLEHPNIVSMHGVCCLPPTVCIIMELCNGGSLTDWLANRKQRWFPQTLESVFQSRWWKPICKLMIDAAAGVAQIHRHSMVHLDIKSMNFLVTQRSDDQEQDGNSIPKTTEQVEQQKLPLDQQQNPDVVVKLADLENVVITTNFGHEFRDSNRDARFHTSTSEIEVPDTLDWTAPELLRDGGRAASTASDVYALAMTMWEIVTFGQANPGMKLATPPPCENQGGSDSNVVASNETEAAVPSIKQKLLAGWRPSFDGTGVPDQLRHNIELGWESTPAKRPTAEDLGQAVHAFVVGKDGGGFTTGY